VLALPENTSQPLPLVSYQHGTITQTNAAPTAMSLTGEAGIAVALATSGYATVEADYLGLGDSPGLHPYHHARSEATACVDLLRAAKTICATNGFPLTNRLFLCGYSQGGHATMALFRELETLHADEFTVTACAPMAGAYDMSGVTTADFLSGRALPNPYYFLYLIASYQSVYQLAPTLADLLAPPYNTTLPPLLNGNTSGTTMNAALPSNPTLILKPEYLSAFTTDPRHPLRLALQDNDLYQWRPQAPVRLYHCSGDQDVVVANTQVAVASFQAAGATNVVWIDTISGADHSACAQPSLLAAKLWFDSFR
jgi:pimeloyl-ACP methyl ester carboxylesterase